MTTDDPAIAEAITIHAENLCERENHLWDVISYVAIPTESLTDNRETHKIKFSTDAVLRSFLYQHVRGYSRNEFASKLRKRPSLVKACGFDISQLDESPRQQTLNHAWHKLSTDTQNIIKAAAKSIRQLAVEYDVISEVLVPTAPVQTDDTTNQRDNSEATDQGTKPWKRQKTTKTIELARKHAFPVFNSNRAENRSYEDEEILEMVARIFTMGKSAHGEGEYGWLTEDDTIASGETILRVLKQFSIAESDDTQLTINDFDSEQLPAIAEIRDELLDAFETATDHIIGSIRGADPFKDREVTAAIDITYERFWPSPWKDKERGIAKTTFPSMVSGYKEDGEVKRGYKYATITLVGDTAPIILGVEPVKEDSNWEGEDATSYSKADIVARLLDQAQQYVDIDQVVFDRGFDSYGVYTAVAERDITYLAPVKKYKDNLSVIEDIKTTEDVDAGVIHDVPMGCDGDVHHTAEYIYAPVNDDDADGNYGAYVTNRDHVEPDEIDAVINQYDRRWDIENQYKSIAEFLPRTSSKDYRVRLCNFVLATLLYNLWRLTDYLIKIGVDRPIRSRPVISANTFVRALGEFLRRCG